MGRQWVRRSGPCDGRGSSTIELHRDRETQGLTGASGAQAPVGPQGPDRATRSESLRHDGLHSVTVVTQNASEPDDARPARCLIRSSSPSCPRRRTRNALWRAARPSLPRACCSAPDCSRAPSRHASPSSPSNSVRPSRPPTLSPPRLAIPSPADAGRASSRARCGRPGTARRCTWRRHLRGPAPWRSPGEAPARPR